MESAAATAMIVAPATNARQMRRSLHRLTKLL